MHANSETSMIINNLCGEHCNKKILCNVLYYSYFKKNHKMKKMKKQMVQSAKRVDIRLVSPCVRHRV